MGSWSTPVARGWFAGSRSFPTAGAVFEDKFVKAVRLFGDQLTDFFENRTERYVLNNDVLEANSMERYRGLR